MHIKEDTDINKINNMIAINLTPVKNILKLAMLATLTYLLFNITSGYNITQVRFNSADTSTILPGHDIK
jgi:hypothetical protein